MRIIILVNYDIQSVIPCLKEKLPNGFFLYGFKTEGDYKNFLHLVIYDDDIPFSAYIETCQKYINYA